MKTFIDRFVYFTCNENGAKIKDKSAVIAVPFEEENPETAALLIAFFEKCFKYLQLKFVNKIIVPGVTNKGEILNRKECLEAAYKCGVDLA
jgi:hypothetical protein